MKPPSSFRSVRVDPFSASTICLKICSGNAVLGSATGFFLSSGSRTYLISNWHVFAGRDRYSGQCLDEAGREPTHFEISPSWRKGVYATFDGPLADQIRKAEELATKMFRHKIELRDADGRNIWFQHASLGQKADVAGILLAEGLLTRTQWLAANHITDTLGPVAVGMDLFVVGYIDAVNSENSTPIWKRATVASEPDAAINGEKCFLVDCRTQKGMSGSPVFHRSRIVGNSIVWDEKKVAVKHTEFVGIYSGRHKDVKIGSNIEDQTLRRYVQENYLDLGFVWSRALIEEMIGDQAEGSYRLGKST